MKLPHGIPGAGLTEIERDVPDGEAPPWPVNADLKIVGHPTTRQDGIAKVTGQARYPSDIRLPGMLYASLVCSPHPHARIRSLDTAAASKHPGVHAVHIVEKVKGVAEVKDPSAKNGTDYPIVRFAGQPIAAVAAATQAAADEAAAKVKVEYEELPFVVDLDEARKEAAPTVYPAPAVQEGTAGGGGGARDVPQHGNVRGPARGRPRGDVEAGFAASAEIVQAEFRTQVQTHCTLETHGVVADWKPDALTVYASTQGTLSVRDELSEVFGLQKSKVRVLTEYMGAGFGSKFGAGNAGVIATHLSKKAGAPVRLFMTRKQEQTGTGNRPDSTQTIRIGATKDGKLQAIHLVSYGTAGVGTGAGTAGPVQNLYECPNVLTEEYDVFTHAGPGAAFRAPGHPQGCFALEGAMEELADRLGIDPLVMMDRNDPHAARREERRIGAEKFRWSERRPHGSGKGRYLRGLGVAQSVWYRLNDMDSGCEVTIARDGSVMARSAVQDIGGGIKTVIAQIVAEELGLRPVDVTISIGDTLSPPGPASGGSMTTSSITPAVRNAAWKAKMQLLDKVAASLGVPASDLKLERSHLTVSSSPGHSLTFRQAAARMGTEQITARADRAPDYGERARITLGGVQFVALAVDTETGRIAIERVLAVHDCGRPMNPLAIESQVNGGIIQGISYALYEDRILDRNTGLMVNPNLEQYKIAGSREVPEIEVALIEQYIARSSTDASGIGEPATIPTVAAISSAFHNATGVWLRRIPMTPARVLEVLSRSAPASPAKGGAR